MGEPAIFDWQTAFYVLQRGTPVKRIGWLGYWILDGDDLVMVCKDGRRLTLHECDTCLTLENMAAKDWMVVSKDLRRELDAIHFSKLLAKSNVEKED